MRLAYALPMPILPTLRSLLKPLSLGGMTALGLVLASCSTPSESPLHERNRAALAGSASLSDNPRISYSAPQILNGSQWDPKERQRSGLGYTEDDFSTFRRNGARGYIARTGKGDLVDSKAVRFLRAANRQGMLLGTYHYYLPNRPVTWQADRYVNRVRAVSREAGVTGKPILLVADFDSKTKSRDMLAFLQRVEQRTGVRPVVYLENGDSLRRELRSASPSVKSQLRRYPLWIALYSHEAPPNSLVDLGRPLTPELNARSYGVWKDYAIWQYGGVLWENRRSRPKVYNHGSFRAPAYFGNLDRPVERNVFKGGNLNSFWAAHSWTP